MYHKNLITLIQKLWALTMCSGEKLNYKASNNKLLSLKMIRQKVVDDLTQWGFWVISESDMQIARCSINQNRLRLH